MSTLAGKNIMNKLTSSLSLIYHLPDIYILIQISFPAETRFLSAYYDDKIFSGYQVSRKVSCS